MRLREANSAGCLREAPVFRDNVLHTITVFSLTSFCLASFNNTSAKFWQSPFAHFVPHGKLGMDGRNLRQWMAHVLTVGV